MNGSHTHTTRDFSSNFGGVDEEVTGMGERNRSNINASKIVLTIHITLDQDHERIRITFLCVKRNAGKVFTIGKREREGLGKFLFEPRRRLQLLEGSRPRVWHVHVHYVDNE